jgi:hypothetical protein
VTIASGNGMPCTAISWRRCTEEGLTVGSKGTSRLGATRSGRTGVPPAIAEYAPRTVPTLAMIAKITSQSSGLSLACERGDRPPVA